MHFLQFRNDGHFLLLRNSRRKKIVQTSLVFGKYSQGSLSSIHDWSTRGEGSDEIEDGGEELGRLSSLGFFWGSSPIIICMGNFWAAAAAAAQSFLFLFSFSIWIWEDRRTNLLKNFSKALPPQKKGEKHVCKGRFLVSGKRKSAEISR